MTAVSLLNGILWASIAYLVVLNLGYLVLMGISVVHLSRGLADRILDVMQFSPRKVAA